MKPLVASFSFLNTWGICPHQAYRRYIAKDLPREPESPEMKYGNAVHDAIEQRIRGKKLLPETMGAYEKWVAPLDKVHVEPEQKLGITASGRPCEFFADDVWLRGKLDAPFLLSTDTAVLIDWKTGKPREEPLELEIGALLLQARRPEITKLIGFYVWLKEGRKGEQHDLSDTARTWHIVNEVMRVVGTSIERNHFPKKQGPLCSWCAVTDCQYNRRGK